LKDKFQVKLVLLSKKDYYFTFMVLKMKTVWNWHLPLKTASEANSSEHWTKKAKRHKLQKQKIKAILLKERPKITIPCNVLLTRISPRQLDVDDNLPMSFKYISDAIAEYFYPGLAPGRADGMGGIKFEFKQEKGNVKEYAITIQMSCES
jgi:hypothetical protein